MNAAWAAEYMGTFKPEYLLHELAQQYHERCEAFDRTVCTGPIGMDGIMPANPRELMLINRNALPIFRELRKEAENAGYSAQDFQRAVAHSQPRWKL